MTEYQGLNLGGALRKQWWRQPGTAACSLCLAALGVLPSVAWAGEWRITPFVEVQETATDNARSVSRGKEADLITEMTGGLRISGKGARANLNLNYSATYEKYLDASDLDGFRQNLAGTGKTEIVKDSIFVDGQASIARVDQDRGGTVSGSDRNTGSNQQDVYTYSLSPYWRQQLGRFAESELRVKRSQSFTSTPSSSSGTAAGATTAANSSSDTVSHEVSTALASGAEFTRLLWKLSASAKESERSLGTSKFYNAEGKAQFDINNGFALLFTGGYDDIEDVNLTEDVSGPYALGGFLWTPSPRTRVRLQAGYRYQSPSYEGEANWDITARTRFTAKVSDTIGLAIDDFLGALSNTRVDRNGNFVDRSTGLIYSGRDVSGLSTNDSLNRTKTFSATLGTTWPRDSMSLSFVHTERETLSGNTVAGSLNNPGSTQTVDTLVLNYGHALTPTLSSSVTLSYSESTSGGTTGGRSDQTLRATTALSYSLTQTLTGSLSYSYLDRNGNSGAVVSSGNQGDVTENVLTVTLRKTF